MIHAPGGVADATVEQTVGQVVDEISARVPRISITSPYSDAGRFQISSDGTIAFAELSLADRSDAAFADAVDRIGAVVERVDVPGLSSSSAGDRFAAAGGGAVRESASWPRS